MGVLDAENANRPSRPASSRPTGQTASGYQGLSGLVSSGSRPASGGYSGSYGHGGGSYGGNAAASAYNAGYAAARGAGGTAGGFTRGMANTGNRFSGSGPGSNPFSAAVNSFQAPRAQISAPQVQNRANPVARVPPSVSMAAQATQRAQKATANYNPLYGGSANTGMPPLGFPRQYSSSQVALMGGGKTGQRSPTAMWSNQPPRHLQTAMPSATAAPAPARTSLFAGNQGAGVGGQQPVAGAGAPAGLRSIFTADAQQGFDPSANHRRVIDTLIAESNLRDPMGLISTAHVMNNRSKYSGASIYDVVSAPNAFTGFEHPGDDAKIAMQDPAVRARAEQAFQDAVTGRVPDPTGGSDYFRTPKSSYGEELQSQLTPSVQMAGHEFFVGPKGDKYRTQGPYDRNAPKAAEAEALFAGNQRPAEGPEPVMASLAGEQMAAERAAKMPYVSPDTRPQFVSGGIGSDRSGYAPVDDYNVLRGIQAPERSAAFQAEYDRLRGQEGYQSLSNNYQPGEESYTPRTEVPYVPGEEHSTPYDYVSPITGRQPDIITARINDTTRDAAAGDPLTTDRHEFSGIASGKPANTNPAMGLSFDVNIPASTPPPSGKANVVLGQFRQAGVGTPLQIVWRAEDGSISARTETGGVSTYHKLLDKADNIKGNWHHFDVDGVWSNTSTGQLKVNVNGAEKLSLLNTPNLPSNAGTVYSKFGLYRADSDTGTTRPDISAQFRNVERKSKFDVGGYAGQPGAGGTPLAAQRQPPGAAGTPLAPQAGPNSAAAMDLRGIDPATLDAIQFREGEARGTQSYTPRSDTMPIGGREAYRPENSPRAAAPTYQPADYSKSYTAEENANRADRRLESATKTPPANPIQAAVEGGSWMDTLKGGVKAAEDILKKGGDFIKDPVGQGMRAGIEYALANPKEALRAAQSAVTSGVSGAFDAAGQEVGKAMSAFAPRFVNAASQAGEAGQLIGGAATRDPVETALQVRNLSGSIAEGWSTLNKFNPTEMQKTRYSQMAAVPVQRPNLYDEPGYTPPEAPELVARALGPSGRLLEVAKGVVDTGKGPKATPKVAVRDVTPRPAMPPQEAADIENTVKATTRPSEGMAERAAQVADARNQPRNRQVSTTSIPYAGEKGTVAMPAGDYSSPKTAPWQNDLPTAITQSASILQVDPVDLAGIIHFESGFNPAVKGGKNGVHVGLIQFGVPEQKQYGITTSSSVADQMQAATQFALDRGFKPGVHGAKELYATINAGNPGGGNKSDTAAGGTWGTANEKFFQQMDSSRAKGRELLGSKTYTGGYGGTGTTAFGQNLQDVTAGSWGANPDFKQVTPKVGTPGASSGAFQPNYVEAPPAAAAGSPAVDARPTRNGVPIAQPASPASPALVASLTERLQSYRGKDHAGTAISRQEVEAFLALKNNRLLRRLTTEGRLELLAHVGRHEHGGRYPPGPTHAA